MPFSVTQVNQVQFELVEPLDVDNDFLKLILEDGEILYVKFDKHRYAYSGLLYDPSFQFDPEFLPVSLKAQIDGYIDEWVSYGIEGEWSTRNIKDELASLRRRKKSIRRWYANQLYRSLDFVQGSADFHNSRSINIGTKVTVEYDVINPDGGNVTRQHWEYNISTRWTASARIAAIRPITREEIRSELAGK